MRPGRRSLLPPHDLRDPEARRKGGVDSDQRAGSQMFLESGPGARRREIVVNEVSDACDNRCSCPDKKGLYVAGKAMAGTPNN